jgi:ATP-binding protein involved in chromosome partitioning
MNMVMEKDVLDALRVIIDPDFHQDIVTLGFVQDIRISDDSVAFTIELTTPACPIKDQFKEQAERVVRVLPGVADVIVTMTARSRPPRKLAEGSGLNKVANILAVTSCKGGVGKSTVAAMLAVNLARRGYRTGLLDADIFGPSVPTLFNLHETGVETTAHEYIVPRQADGLAVMSFGFMLGDQPAVMRGPMVSNFVQQLLHQVAWGTLDYLVVDFPPGTGDIQLTLSQQAQIDAAVIVTTPHALSLTDVRKGILMFEKVDVPVIGVVENMAYFVCDGCDKRHAIFGDSGDQQLRDRFGLETLSTLPIRPALQAGIDALAGSEEAVMTTDAVIRALGYYQAQRPQRPEIEATESHIHLHWPDGSTTSVANRALRLACGCALCVDEMSHKPVLEPESVPLDIHAEELRTIGNYALGITWSDGHATGFFPYKTIKAIAAG